MVDEIFRFAVCGAHQFGKLADRLDGARGRTRQDRGQGVKQQIFATPEHGLGDVGILQFRREASEFGAWMQDQRGVG